MSPVQKHFVSMRRLNRTMLGQKSIIGDNLRKAGWNYVSAVDRHGQTMWIADAHRGNGKRSVGRADEKLTAFMELEAAIGSAKRTFRVRIAEHYGN
jgi:hypothetical protein